MVFQKRHRVGGRRRRVSRSAVCFGVVPTAPDALRCHLDGEESRPRSRCNLKKLPPAGVIVIFMLGIIAIFNNFVIQQKEKVCNVRCHTPVTLASAVSFLFLNLEINVPQANLLPTAGGAMNVSSNSVAVFV